MSNTEHFISKPSHDSTIPPTAKDAAELISAADKHRDAIFAIMYNQRTNPLYAQAKRLVESGRLGKIIRADFTVTDWYRSQYYYDMNGWRASWSGEGGGTLINQCVHQLDLLQWICGMPKKVRALCHFGKWHNIETEDDVTAYLEFPNGATGVFVTSTADSPGTNRLEILCSRGRIVCEKDTLTIDRHDGELQTFLMSEPVAFSEPGFKTEIIPQGGENPQHVGILNNVANAVLGIEPLYVDGKEGIKCVELINAMLLSAWKNEEVSLPVDDDEYYRYLQQHIAASKKKSGEDILIDKTKEVLDTFELSRAQILDKISQIVVLEPYHLIYELADGSVADVHWTYPSRNLSWTKEMREVARQRALEQHRKEKR